MTGPAEAEGNLSQPLQLLLVLWSWAALSFGHITHSAHCPMMSSHLCYHLHIAVF